MFTRVYLLLLWPKNVYMGIFSSLKDVRDHLDKLTEEMTDAMMLWDPKTPKVLDVNKKTKLDFVIKPEIIKIREEK